MAVHGPPCYYYSPRTSTLTLSLTPDTLSPAVDNLQVLGMLPDDVALSDVLPWVSGVLGYLAQEARGTSVVKNLRRWVWSSWVVGWLVAWPGGWVSWVVS